MKLSAYIKQLESLLASTGDVEVVSYTGGYLHNAPNPRIQTIRESATRIVRNGGVLLSVEPKSETVVAVG